MSIQEPGREDFSCFIHNRPKLQTAPMAPDWWMDRQAAVWQNPIQSRRRFTLQLDWFSKTPHWLKEAGVRRSLLIWQSERDRTTVMGKDQSRQGLWVRTGGDGKETPVGSLGRGNHLDPGRGGGYRNPHVHPNSAQTQGCAPPKVNFTLC